ncbi:hypothetical protein [Pseudactinotalea suaedae]|uniref:hypothetical protein n=1 Tax=Pseudactinotalea suaedae TaxID=1524924 RepID=UPI0012E10E6B|nr:hypothetical protein [Pseudactinotalea suaedae]
MPEDQKTRLRPDDVTTFRVAQLLLMLAETESTNLDLERLSVTEFLAANPFLIVGEDRKERTALRLAGFGEHSLTYAAPGQRFATRRERIANDVAYLVSFGLAQVVIADQKRVIRATPFGIETAGRLTSVYADGYRESVRRVAPRVSKLSDKALQEHLTGWLRADPVLFDLVDADGSADAVASRRPSATAMPLVLEPDDG